MCGDNYFYIMLGTVNCAQTRTTWIITYGKPKKKKNCESVTRHANFWFFFFLTLLILKCCCNFRQSERNNSRCRTCWQANVFCITSLCSYHCTHFFWYGVLLYLACHMLSNRYICPLYYLYYLFNKSVAIDSILFLKPALGLIFSINEYMLAVERGNKFKTYITYIIFSLIWDKRILSNWFDSIFQSHVCILTEVKKSLSYTFVLSV